MSAVACGGSPTSPSVPSNPAMPNASGPIHDTLNATGSAATADGVWSERSGGDDRQVYDDFVSPTAATIRIVAWQGIRPTAHAPTRFYLSFIADNGGFPLLQGAATNSRPPQTLFSSTILIHQVNKHPCVT